MYARMIQLIAKSGQGKDLSKAMQERALPILKQQPGFVDVLALNSDTDPNQFVGITVWKSKEDADKYLGGQAQQVLAGCGKIVRKKQFLSSFVSFSSAGGFSRRFFRCRGPMWSFQRR